MAPPRHDARPPRGTCLGRCSWALPGSRRCPHMPKPEAVTAPGVWIVTVPGAGPRGAPGAQPEPLHDTSPKTPVRTGPEAQRRARLVPLVVTELQPDFSFFPRALQVQRTAPGVQASQVPGLLGRRLPERKRIAGLGLQESAEYVTSGTPTTIPLRSPPKDPMLPTLSTRTAGACPTPRLVSARTWGDEVVRTLPGRRAAATGGEQGLRDGEASRNRARPWLAAPPQAAHPTRGRDERWGDTRCCGAGPQREPHDRHQRQGGSPKSPTAVTTDA